MRIKKEYHHQNPLAALGSLAQLVVLAVNEKPVTNGLHFVPYFGLVR
jgi:hypothetical protein